MEKFDAFGPEKIVEVYDPASGMRGVVVIDNTALGPGKGGIRMTATVDTAEVFRLARTMSWKNALAGLPFGGAKSGIFANPKTLSLQKKKKIVESFARALRCVSPKEYVAAPDMGMAEREMEWFAKANGSMKSCTGKPKRLGGIPHELGSTGFGVYHAALVALKHAGLDVRQASFAVEGFGNVGVFAAKFLAEKGAKLVSVSDSKGCYCDHKGIDFAKLAAVKKKTGSVVNYGKKEERFCAGCRGLSMVDCDLLVTAAIPNFINETNHGFVRAKVVVEGSNIPMTAETEKKLYDRGVLVVPDFVANAGGVISSYVEYSGGGEKKMFKLVEQKIKKNTETVLARSEKQKIPPREAAMEIAAERIKKAMKKRGR